MKKKMSKRFVASVIMIIISLVAGTKLYFKMNGKMMDLYKYYNLDKSNASQVAIVLEDEVCKDEKAIVVQNETYVDLSVMCDKVSSQFFWDAENKALIVTSPNAIMTCSVGANKFNSGGQEQSFDKVIVLEQNQKKYISLSFVQKVCNLESKFYKNPNRLVFNYSFGKKENKVKATSSGMIRYQASDESDILKEVKKDEVLYVMDTDDKEFFSPNYLNVMSEDGFFGYIRKKYVSKEYEEERAAKEKSNAPEYTQLAHEGKVCIGWFNVTKQEANNLTNYNTFMSNATSVNVVSPTWLSVMANTGDVSSITSSEYVQKFHSSGKKVWVAVQDFDGTSGQVGPISETLQHTKTRGALENNIVAEVEKVGADGVNIDFENINEETGKYYIQFLRELETKCRAKNLVLSVDSYVPKYRAQYKIGEQGKFVDYVVIMAYDKVVGNKNEDEKDSTSPIEWVNDDSIQGSFKRGVPANRLVIGLPFFSLVYQSKADGTSIKTQKQSISVLATEMKANNAKVSWDDIKKQNYVEYTANGVVNEFWIEDEKSMVQKLAVLQKNNVAGVGLWRLGQDTKEIWGPINNYMKQ